MIDVVLIPGHDARNVGAYAVDLDGNPSVSEYAFATTLVKQLHTKLTKNGVTSNILFRPYAGPWEIKEEQLLSQIATLRPTCVIEFHFNTLNKKTFAAGTWLNQCVTALHFPEQEESKNLAEFIVPPVQELLRLEHSKIQKQTRSWERKQRNAEGRWTPAGRPLTTLTADAGAAILLETHVGSDPDVHANAMAALTTGTLAETIATAIEQYLAAKS